jgi:hypothetical protein
VLVDGHEGEDAFGDLVGLFAVAAAAPGLDPTFREVRPVWTTLANRLTSSPTNTGLMKVMPSMAMVAQRPAARWKAIEAAARSICDQSQPPKMSPSGLVSDGMAMARSTGASCGHSAAAQASASVSARRDSGTTSVMP